MPKSLLNNPTISEIRKQIPELKVDIFVQSLGQFVQWMYRNYGGADWDRAKQELGMDGIVARIRAYAAKVDQP